MFLCETMHMFTYIQVYLFKSTMMYTQVYTYTRHATLKLNKKLKTPRGGVTTPVAKVVSVNICFIIWLVAKNMQSYYLYYSHCESHMIYKTGCRYT